MSDLIYPNLFLFLYDLREGLGEDETELAKNRSVFAGKLPEHLRDSLFKFDIAFETEYHELLPQQIEKFPDSDKPCEGYYYPVRLNDTYGLILACSLENNAIRNPVDSVAKLKAKTEEKLKDSEGHIQTGTLGQTWLILAQLANSNSDPTEVAKNCCKELNLGLNWEQHLQGKGNLLGGTFFELRSYRLVINDSNSPASPLPPSIQHIQQNHHVIIALYPDAATAKKASELNFSWLRLFCYRHKILWAYGQSRYLKQQLKKEFIKIQYYVSDIQKYETPHINIKKLKKTLKNTQSTLYRYAINLNHLDDQSRTIKINLHNYQKRLLKIQEDLSQKQARVEKPSINSLISDAVLSWLQSSQAGNLMTNASHLYFLDMIAKWQNNHDLKVLSLFSDEVENKYYLQLQKDYENLSPGLKLLEDLINSVRGFTEIDQAELDRTFQTLVGVFGLGLGAASVAASFSSIFPYFDPIKFNSTKDKAEALNKHFIASVLSNHLQVPDPWLVPATASFYCFVVAVTTGTITALVIRLWWMALKWRERSR